MQKVLSDIKFERMRQMNKGYKADHDDQYQHGELPSAAISYTLSAGGNDMDAEVSWPWPIELYDKASEKPMRQKLVIAAALLVAEIERLDRVQ